ncbi:helix-turn-helix domain-containing protein [Ectopseudomonas guguanensis]|uniref:helix-turn-helix domain-containing protein n=1 Tax=Ectopseudomonas guguanensis TaxID=1198456 RepID=UPI0017D17894|nr:MULTISPECIES: helix-turn-helix domain-containing protein [Pseudomonas]
MTPTEELLLNQFNSPLLSLEQVAKILDRSPQGLRITLSGEGELARRLRPAKVRVGRRVLFRISELARFIDEA